MPITSLVRRWLPPSAGLLTVGVALGAVGTWVSFSQAGALSGPPAGRHVAVRDYRFDPATVPLSRGGTVVFDFEGPSRHTATDATGMDLYDSGMVGEGGPSTWFTFPAAGEYRFTCSPHAWMGGRVQIPMLVSPARTERRALVKVVWAGVAASDGFVYDVQLQRPGSDWKDWRSGVLERMSSYSPAAGKGVYRFRARMRSLTEGEAAWSAEALLRVD